MLHDPLDDTAVYKMLTPLAKPLMFLTRRSYALWVTSHNVVQA